MAKIHLICLALLTAISISSCNGTAGLTVCVSDPHAEGLWCSKDGKPRFLLPYSQSENYIAMPPDDFRTALEKCQSGGAK